MSEMTMTEVLVTQEAREAAWPFRPECYTKQDRAAWMAGKYDNAAPVIKAFSKFEQDIRQKRSAEAVAWMPAPCLGMAQNCGWKEGVSTNCSCMTAPPAPEGGVERLAMAVGNALYGPKFDAFTNPEAYDFCEKVARTALSDPHAG